MKRKITEDELRLVRFLMESSRKKYEVPEMVTEYGNPYLGSINFTDYDSSVYVGDLARATFNDQDDIPVMVSLTLNSDNQLLDLDFWKEDFSRVSVIPPDEKITIIF